MTLDDVEHMCARNFEQLLKLKARSRQPIDIQSQGGINFKSINSHSDERSKKNFVENEEKEVKPLIRYFSFVNKLYEAPLSSLYKRETKSLDSANEILKASTSTVSSLKSDYSNDSGCCTRSSVDNQSTSEHENSFTMNEDIIDSQEVNKMKTICQQLFSKTAQQQNPIKRKKNTKLLTILFDYVDSNNFNSTRFSVSKGESVYLIRELNEKFYLVLKANTGTLGYIPKDYTIDLKEIKRKLKNNLKKQATKNFNTKLTQL